MWRPCCLQKSLAGQRTRTSTSDTPSLPRPTTKTVFAEDCLHAATSAAQRGWSLESQAKSPAARGLPRAACEGRGGTSTTFLRTAAKSRLLGGEVASFMLNLAIIAGVKAASAVLICLRSATRPAIRLRSLSVSSWAVHRLCSSSDKSPCDSPASPTPLACAFLVPKTTVHLCDCPARRHTWGALAFAFAWRASAAKLRLATFRTCSERVAPPSSLPAQAIVHPPSASATAVWSPDPAHEPPTHLHGARSVLFSEQPSCRAARQSSLSNCSPQVDSFNQLA